MALAWHSACPGRGALRASLFLLLLPSAAASHKDKEMLSYRRTSHSLAMVVHRPEDVEDFSMWFSQSGDAAGDAAEKWFSAVGKSSGAQELPHQPWWWLVGVPADSSDELPWDDLVKQFDPKMSNSDQTALITALARGRDDEGIDDPKVRTVKSGDLLFRAVPQGRCDNHTSPPRASFLPQVLPPVETGQCVLELCHLKPKQDYKILLFNVSDAALPPESPLKPYAEAHAKTAATPQVLGAMRISLLSVCILAMLVAIIWQVRAECAGLAKPANYSQVALVGNDEGLGGFHQVKVKHLFLHILKDMLISMTMFLPVIGPVGLILASDIVIGSRWKRLKRSQEDYTEANEHKMGVLWQFLRDIWILIVNIVIIPFNMYTVQLLWATYLHSWYDRFHLDLFQDSSYNDLQRYGDQWQEVSGLELGGWVPGIVVSTLLLTLEIQNDSTSLMLLKHRSRAEAHLNALAKGKELWMKLCKMDSHLFARTVEVPDLLGTRVRRFILAVTFSLIPHVWMWLRHGAHLLDSPMLWVTLVYIVNIAGVSTRFLALSDKIHFSYRRNCQELCTFQALSWQEDMSQAIYDPFATRNHHVMEARKALRENIPRIASLKLEEPEDSKVWWHLRELVFIQIKEGRILMEMMVLMSVSLALLLGVSSLVVMNSLREITAITIVTPIVMVVLLRFTHVALALARDINSMYTEHTCLLHNIVAEMNMPLRPQMPLDSHLQQERFLLQVATVIEKQTPPETIASFAVTPQLLSLVVGTLSVLTAVSVYNLANGILTMHPSRSVT